MTTDPDDDTLAQLAIMDAHHWLDIFGSEDATGRFTPETMLAAETLAACMRNLDGAICEINRMWDSQYKRGYCNALTTALSRLQQIALDAARKET